MAIKIDWKIVSWKQATKPIKKKKEKVNDNVGKEIFYIDEEYKLYYWYITIDEWHRWITIMAYRSTDNKKQYQLMKVDRKHISFKKK